MSTMFPFLHEPSSTPTTLFWKPILLRRLKWSTTLRSTMGWTTTWLGTLTGIVCMCVHSAACRCLQRSLPHVRVAGKYWEVRWFRTEGVATTITKVSCLLSAIDLWKFVLCAALSRNVDKPWEKVEQVSELLWKALWVLVSASSRAGRGSLRSCSEGWSL